MRGKMLTASVLITAALVLSGCSALLRSSRSVLTSANQFNGCLASAPEQAPDGSWCFDTKRRGSPAGVGAVTACSRDPEAVAWMQSLRFNPEPGAVCQPTRFEFRPGTASDPQGWSIGADLLRLLVDLVNPLALRSDALESRVAAPVVRMADTDSVRTCELAIDEAMRLVHQIQNNAAPGEAYAPHQKLIAITDEVGDVLRDTQTDLGQFRTEVCSDGGSVTEARALDRRTIARLSDALERAQEYQPPALEITRHFR